MTDCIFCKIVSGEIPSAKVYEDEVVYAFLDNSQTTVGHTLLIPKKHVADIFEYNEELAAQVFSRLPKISRAIEEGLPDVKGLNIINNNRELAYQTVFHSHIHLIPRYETNDGLEIKFTNNAENYTETEYQDRAQKISKAIKE